MPIDIGNDQVEKYTSFYDKIKNIMLGDLSNKLVL